MIAATDRAAVMNDVARLIAVNAQTASLRAAIRSAPDWRVRLDAIRAYYRRYEQMCGTDYTGCDPYESGLYELLTPIERLLWSEIRSARGMQMVMQYPVGPYVLDFADPVRRLAIEADGAAFHTLAADEIRDRVLWATHGWKVYRISGAECRRECWSPGRYAQEYRERHEVDPPSFDVAMMADTFYSMTAMGVVQAIQALEIEEAYQGPHLGTMKRALNSHRLADFPVGR